MLENRFQPMFNLTCLAINMSILNIVVITYLKLLKVEFYGVPHS